MKKIGLLGGTFDPPHNGHLIIANEVLTQCQLNEIWFIPAYVPPHKQKMNVTKLEHRVNMVKLAIESHPSFRLSTIEIKRKGPSYTYDTIKSLKVKYPDVLFYFIIGTDMVQDLPNWKKIDELIKMTTFIGVDRPGFSFKSKYAHVIETVEAPLIDISSTFLRQRFQNKQSTRYYLPDNVRQYIKENHLYESTSSSPNY